jgi:release factor glutamine methyltransferase
MSALTDELMALLAQAGVAQAAAEAGRIVNAATAAESGPANVGQAARTMAHRRAAGEPLAYVIGREVFMGVELIAAAGALAPREETELLGHAALEALRACQAEVPRLIDMCCGSGNLACALAHHFPAARIWASDLTDGCMAVTRQNVAHAGVSERVQLAQGDLFAGLAGHGLEGTIDIIVCNPPYISQGKLASDRVELLAHEPREAFDGGPYGLSIHQRVIKEALPFLRPNGILLVEIGLGQDRQVKMLFDRTKNYDNIQLLANSAGQVRVITGRKQTNNQHD